MNQYGCHKNLKADYIMNSFANKQGTSAISRSLIYYYYYYFRFPHFLIKYKTFCKQHRNNWNLTKNILVIKLQLLYNHRSKKKIFNQQKKDAVYFFIIDYYWCHLIKRFRWWNTHWYISSLHPEQLFTGKEDAANARKSLTWF